MADGMQQVIEWPHTCNEGVTARGMYEPCEATAVAVRLDPAEHTPYPVCARHCRGELVPLGDVVAAAQEVTHG